MPAVEDLLAAIRGYLPDADLALVRRAYAFSAHSHDGQLRKSGEAYFAHPVAVAFLLARLRLDVAAISAGLLHDVAEDTEVTVDEIARRFSAEVSAIVDGVTKLEAIKYSNQQARQAENFRKMLVAMSKDIRVLLIKLADRLHNMSTLDFKKPDSQRKIAQETLEIYAPLANRLGIGWMKAQLEDLAFRYLHPDEYKRLSHLVGARQVERQHYVLRAVDEIRQLMLAEGLPNAQVSGRPKHLFGIWKKMDNGRVPYEQIYDTQGFRVVVADIKECYQALGAVHTHWKPIPGRFKDYIALPKANRYQSLHTSVMGPGAERIEIQIRTSEMHRLAEEGVACHWRYKERGESISVRDEERFTWLKQLLEFHTNAKDADEFMDSMRVDLFNDEVYTFTPKGELKVMQRGATPVDFAYAVHTKVGERTVGAKVDNVMVPLRTALRSGNVVEIMTRPDARPSKDWMDFAVTARARSKIRAYLHAEQRARSREIGLDLLEKALRRLKCSLSRAENSDRLANVLALMGIQNWDELAVAVGFGKADAEKFSRLLLPDAKAESAGQEEDPDAEVKRPRKGKRGKGVATIVVDGLDDVLVRYAKCCSPVPGDPVVGVVTRGRGITVHQRSCSKVLDADPMRRLDCEWNTTGGSGATVTVRVFTENASGMLAAMSQRFTDAGIDICSANCRTEGRRAVNDFEVVVADVAQLNGVIASLGRLRGVARVERVRG
ncbi:MAG: bifunctional (p)ppGpp synthetase/guanosine-3',5'-bis(diphosphate) 3'-pyrophosphohydrolase [Deltaproteobacteria bacterium]|nr:bifunctional (p)ppGpp synthetase/guanosine-3',5'-bis(diphosphate) 3'-pyrophosphohydrolase [Deltaproteobacteria bacterium]